MGNSTAISCQSPQINCVQETTRNTCHNKPAQKDEIYIPNVSLGQDQHREYTDTDRQTKNPLDMLAREREQLGDKHFTDHHQLHHQLAPHFSGACLHAGKLAFKQLKDYRGKFVALLFVEECSRESILEIVGLEQTLEELSCSKSCLLEILVCLPERIEEIQRFMVENRLNINRMWIYSDREKKIFKNFMKEKSNKSRMQGDNSSIKSISQSSSGFVLIDAQGYLNDLHFFDQDTKQQQQWNSQSLIHLIGQKILETSRTQYQYDPPHSGNLLESLGGERGIHQLDILFFQIAQSYPLLNSICQDKLFKQNHVRFLIDALSNRSNQNNPSKVGQQQQLECQHPKLELDADSQQCYGLVLKQAISEQLSKTKKNCVYDYEYHKQQQTQSVFLAIKQRMKSIGYSTFELLGQSMSKMSDMIQEIISKATADSQLALFFHDSSSPSAFSQQSQEFQQIHANRVHCFAQCLGASHNKEDTATPYDLNSLKQAHAHLRITSKHFSIFLGHFKAGLVSRGISSSQADKTVMNLRNLEGCIVSERNDVIGSYEDSLVFHLGGKHKVDNILAKMHEKIRNDVVFEKVDQQRLISRVREVVYQGNYLRKDQKVVEAIEKQGYSMQADKKINAGSDRYQSQEQSGSSSEQYCNQKRSNKPETLTLSQIQQEILKLYFYQSCIDVRVSSIEGIVFTCDILFPHDASQMEAQQQLHKYIPNSGNNSCYQQFDEQQIQKISSTMSTEAMKLERLSVLLQGQHTQLLQEFCQFLLRLTVRGAVHKNNNIHSQLQLLGSISIKLHLREIHFDSVKHCFEQSLRKHNMEQSLINESSILLARIKDYFIFDERPQLLQCLGGEIVLANGINEMLQVLKRQKNEKSLGIAYNKVVEAFERVSDLKRSIKDKILAVIVILLEDNQEEVLKTRLTPSSRIHGTEAQSNFLEQTTEKNLTNKGFTDSEFDQFKRMLCQSFVKQGVEDQTLLRKICSKLENLRQFLVTQSESLLCRLGGKLRLQEMIAILLTKIKSDDRLVEIFPEKAISAHKEIFVKFLMHRLSKQSELENPYGFPQNDECCTDSRNKQQYSVDNQCLASTDSDWQSSSCSSNQMSWEQRIGEAHQNVQQLHHFHVDVFKALLRDSLMQIEVDETVIQDILELHIEPFRSSLVTHIGCNTPKYTYF